MKDKISKLKNLVKKYGLAGTIKKAAGYIYSNYLVKLSVKERIYVAVNKKKRKYQVEQVVRKQKRAMIRDDIRRQKKERARQAQIAKRMEEGNDNW